MSGTPLKCGMKIDPPAFVLIYKVDDKIKKKVMPLRNFKIDSNVKFVADDLRKRHCLNDVPLIKIEKILRFLQELIKGADKCEAISVIEREFTIKVNEDLNKLPNEEIEFQKQLMDSVFAKNQIKEGSKEFVYDKQVNFDDAKEGSNWDEDREDNFWD